MASDMADEYADPSTEEDPEQDNGYAVFQRYFIDDYNYDFEPPKPPLDVELSYLDYLKAFVKRAAGSEVDIQAIASVVCFLVLVALLCGWFDGWVEAHNSRRTTGDSFQDRLSFEPEPVSRVSWSFDQNAPHSSKERADSEKEVEQPAQLDD